MAVAWLADADVMAVLACGPAAPAQQSGGGGGAEERVSVPATEAPFELLQSGDGEKERPAQPASFNRQTGAVWAVA